LPNGFDSKLTPFSPCGRAAHCPPDDGGTGEVLAACRRNLATRPWPTCSRGPTRSGSSTTATTSRFLVLHVVVGKKVVPPGCGDGVSSSPANVSSDDGTVPLRRPVLAVPCRT
jgi:hypothetical protein